MIRPMIAALFSALLLIPAIAGEVQIKDIVKGTGEEADVGKIASDDKWVLTEATEGQRVWTDDYSNVLGAVWRRLRNPDE